MKNKDVIFYLIRERDRYCDQRCTENPQWCDNCKNPLVEAYDEAIEEIEIRKEK